MSYSEIVVPKLTIFYNKTKMPVAVGRYHCSREGGGEGREEGEM